MDKDQRSSSSNMIQAQGIQEHNLKNVDLSIPRNCLVVFTGVSGSGKSSLAFGTLYAEAQKRYLETVAPYARRLFQQIPAPKVNSITGLPPVIALKQQGHTNARSSVGSITTLSNLLRMLYSRAGTYPKTLSHLESEDFSPNTPQGACPQCHGHGWIYDVDKDKLVPNPDLSLRDHAVAAWPGAWQGQNLRDILMMRGVNIDLPWKQLPQDIRDWILYTDETPSEPIYRGLNYEESQEAIKRGEPATYHGTFTSARRYILHSFNTSKSKKMRDKARHFIKANICPICHGNRLNEKALAVTFSGKNIAEMSHLSMTHLYKILKDYLPHIHHKTTQDEVIHQIGDMLLTRLEILLELGLGYLQIDRPVDTLSPGEFQRLRLGTQVYSTLFGVAYVLDEPAAGLHPADIQSLLNVLMRLPASGNSLLIVEHDPAIIKKADWLVDIGPKAGSQGGEILYSGKPDGLKKIKQSQTRAYIFNPPPLIYTKRRHAKDYLKIKDITWRNLKNLDINIPLNLFVCVTGVSGSGKSSLVSQALVHLIGSKLHQHSEYNIDDDNDTEVFHNPEGEIISHIDNIHHLSVITQKPIGRTSRSNLATYTGIFDQIRKLFASLKEAKKYKMDASFFSFNIHKGRCPHCEGLGDVSIELLFMPGVTSPCPVCHGKRYNEKVLSIHYNGKNIADILNMTIEDAANFFPKDSSLMRGIQTLKDSGLGYLRLGQPAPELSGGEAQRLKLATELQKHHSKPILYILDEPTSGLHPSDTDKLIKQLQALVNKGHSVIVAEHNMRVAASSDWIIDMGPYSGDDGGEIVACGPPEKIVKNQESLTAPYLKEILM